MVEELPGGTVTFLFTDIEGSTRLWEEYPDEMKVALARHDSLLRGITEMSGGFVFKTVGDAFCVAFAEVGNALAAALAAQRALIAVSWDVPDGLRVRMAVHSGTADERDGDYFGPTVNRVARLLAAAHGSQILLSLPVRESAGDNLPVQVRLRDLGERRLKDLIRPERIFQLVVPDLPSDFPPLNTLDSRPNNLPAQPTPLIGRETIVAEVRALLLRGDRRLITLTGPGGTGKTRVGLQVAADVIDLFENGVFFVPLASLSDADSVADAIALTLGVREASEAATIGSLKQYLRQKEVLLVLDNFEHVVSAAPEVADLLAVCPGLKVLVTSRSAINIQGESRFPVPPLACPDLKGLPPVEGLSQYAAVSLFAQRAAAVRAGFSLTRENASAVAEICSRLDGLPLAIELAAGRAGVLSPQAMLARWDRRLDLLTGGVRDAPARQRTLRKAIAWSYDLLDSDERALFRRLSIFVGGCTLEAAEWVCDLGRRTEIDVLGRISSLVEKSLLRQEEQAEGEPRFLMLETVREYGLECLAASGEATELGRRHAELFLDLAEEAEPQLRGPEQVVWLDRLQTELGNLTAAVRWCQDSAEAERGLRLVSALWRFWMARGHASRGREWLEASLSESAGASMQVRARAFERAGFLALWHFDWAHAAPLLERALMLFREVGDRHGIATALSDLAQVEICRGKLELAEEPLREALTVLREEGDKHWTAISLRRAGNLAVEQGDYGRGQTLLEESMILSRDTGDKLGVAHSLNGLGIAAMDRDNYGDAGRFLEELLTLSSELGDDAIEALALHNLAEVARCQGKYERAQSLCLSSLALSQEAGHSWGNVVCIELLAKLALALGSAERAARLFAAAEASRTDTGTPVLASERADYDAQVAMARAALGEEPFAIAWRDGRAMTLDEAASYASKGSLGPSR